MLGLGEDGISRREKTRKKPPARSVKAAHDAMLSISGHPSETRSRKTKHSRALSVFTLDLGKLNESGTKLSRVPHVAWKYFWERGAHSTSVEVAHSLLSRRHHPTSRSSGNPVKEVLRLLRKLQKTTHDRGCELRILTAPPLVNLSIWMKSHRHLTDRITPVESIIPHLRPDRTYSMEGFLQALLLEARLLRDHSQHLLRKDANRVGRKSRRPPSR